MSLGKCLEVTLIPSLTFFCYVSARIDIAFSSRN